MNFVAGTGSEVKCSKQSITDRGGPSEVFPPQRFGDPRWAQLHDDRRYRDSQKEVKGGAKKDVMGTRVRAKKKLG